MPDIFAMKSELMSFISIEKLIAVETQKRIAAEALMQNGNDKKSDTAQLEEIAMGIGFGAVLKK